MASYFATFRFGPVGPFSGHYFPEVSSKCQEGASSYSRTEKWSDSKQSAHQCRPGSESWELAEEE